MSGHQNHTSSEPSACTIAVKGFSLSKANGKAKPAPKSSLGKRPRTTFAHDDDSDSDHGRQGKHEAVTGFGEGGAIKREQKRAEGPLVIPRLVNKGLGAKRSKNLLPPEVQAAQEAAAKEARDRASGIVRKDVADAGDSEIAWGLTLTKREKLETSKQDDDGTESNGVAVGIRPEAEEPAQKKTVDQEALEALLGNGEAKKGPDLVIEAVAESQGYSGPVSESDAYKRAMATAPDVSTLEDYDRVPVEEFGAALLRGMGWKGEKRGEVKEVKRRQNLLGLGAKELKDAEELGAWVQKSDTKRLNHKPKGDGGERRPKASDYKREKERRDERREERGGGSYRKERERERERERDSGRDRDRYRERDDYRRR